MSAAEQCDVIVVGGGPAGTAAAIEARRRGLSVTVVDRAEFPRDKTCGDGLTTNALRTLEQLGVPRDSLGGDGGYERVDDVVLVASDGREIALPLPRGRGDFAAVITRLRLDAALVDHARERGADLRLGHGVVAIASGDAEVRVELGDGSSLRAPWVIAADGHWSPTRRMLEPGAPRDLGVWHAARQYFSGVADRRLWVLFERDLLPGYAWVFPLPGGRVNVGYGVLRDHSTPARWRSRPEGLQRRGRDLKALWCDVLERPSIRHILGATARPEGTMRAWPIPTDFRPAGLHHGRVLFAGDAARVVDPMTGEGIAQALETGMLAAAAVSGASTAPVAAVTARYERAVQRSIGRDLRFAALLQRVLCVAARRSRRAARRRRERLDPAELRAVDVRGLSPRHPLHARPLAARPLPRRRRVFARRDVTLVRSACEALIMATTHAEAQIARDADEVWNVFGDFQGIKTWFPGLQEVKPDGPDVRLITMGPGMDITETLLSRDDANRTLTYSVASALLNANKYETTIAVKPTDGGCLATMDAVLDPDNLAEFIGPVYETAVQGLAEHFKS